MGKIFVMQSLASSPVHKFPRETLHQMRSMHLFFEFFHHFNSIFPYRTAKSQGNSAGMEASCIFIHFSGKSSKDNFIHRRILAVVNHLRFTRICAIFVIVNSQSGICTVISSQVIRVNTVSSDLPFRIISNGMRWNLGDNTCSKPQVGCANSYI